MKLTIKIALIISLFCTTAFAGEQGNGGFVCGEQGNGGKCLIENPTDPKTFDQKETQDDLLIFVRDFLTKIFG